jgi:hypothetical protein
MALITIDIPDEFLATYERLKKDGRLDRLANVVEQLKDSRDKYARQDDADLAAQMRALPLEQQAAIKATYAASRVAVTIGVK